MESLEFGDEAGGCGAASGAAVARGMGRLRLALMAEFGPVVTVSVRRVVAAASSGWRPRHTFAQAPLGAMEPLFLSRGSIAP
jgi:hypothetical protein